MQYLQRHRLSPRDTSLGLVPLTLGLVGAGFAAMGGLVARLGRRLVFIGLTVDLAGCGWVLALVNHSGTNVTLWTLAPAFIVIRHRHRPQLRHDPRRRSQRRET